MDTQVENAIDLAFSPATDQGVKSQAYDFLDQLRRDDNGWHVCLTLFTRSSPPSEVVRLVCLEIVNNAAQYARLDVYHLNIIRERLMGYVHQRYSLHSTEVDSPAVQNKLTQTLTYLFTSLYASEWTSFFDDFRSLAGDASSVGSANPAATMLYLRIIGSIHDEIADVMIPRTPAEQKRCNDLKDLIRVRDVNTIAATWQEILSRWRQIDFAVVELGLRTIAKWVSWIDISVVIDRTIQTALLELAGQQGQLPSESKEARVRDAAIDTFTETVGKKMSASDKMELIRYLNLNDIVSRLIASPALAGLRNTPHYDTDLSESVAKLVNNVIFDVVKVLDNGGVEPETISHANELLRSFMPCMLRFFADEYDEICSAVIPSLTDLLTFFRKYVKSRGALSPEHADMLQPILDAIIAKMKYDETTSWGEEDDATDEAEFQELRKKLYVLQQTVAAIDDALYIATLSRVVGNTLSSLDSAEGKPNWRDLDLALHEMYLFGELAVRNGGLYQKSAPSSQASQRLLDMMTTMVDSGLATYPHPAIQLHYVEICVRYVQFFEHNTASIPKALETFVNFVHSEHPKVRLRSWYLFHRFVRHLRAQLGNVAHTVVQAVGDLLSIKAEVPEDKDADDLSSEDNGKSADATFTSQLFLFEAIGCVASTAAVPIDTKVAIAKLVIDPLCSDLQQHLPAAKAGDNRAALQAHHVIMALGTVASGFSDWTPGSTSGGPPPAQVSGEFVVASEAVLTALEALKEASDIRTAARHAFSRMLGVLGSSIFSQLPRWIDGLLSSASSNDEMAMFLRTIAQVVYGFKAEIFSILDSLLSPLLHRVFAGLAIPSAGTDDEIQLKELRREYLSFLLVITAQHPDLAPVLVSSQNQQLFHPVSVSLTAFASDATDPNAARLAFSILSHLASLWGGPDVLASGTPTAPSLPGFDAFLLSTAVPLPFALLCSPTFSSRDPQLRPVLSEAAGLLWVVARKVGAERVLEGLQMELSGKLGMVDSGMEARNLMKQIIELDAQEWKKAWVAWAGVGGAGGPKR